MATISLLATPATALVLPVVITWFLHKSLVYVDMLKNGGSLKINVHCLIFGDFGALRFQ